MKLHVALLGLSSSVLALAATTIHGSRAPSGLTIEVTSANGPTIESIDDLVLVSKVTNHGDQPIRVIKYGGVLDGSVLQSFIVTKDGKDVQFRGAIAQFALTYDDDAMYTGISPGETVSTSHKVAALYDFASAGTGDFTFEPLVDLGLTPVDSGSRTASFVNSIPSISVKVTQDVGIRPLGPDSGLDKRMVPYCPTNATELSMIAGAYNESKLLAAAAATHIANQPTSSIYSLYFKDNVQSTIQQRFRTVADENVPRYLFCSSYHDPAYLCPGDVIVSYSWTQTFDVHVCPIFFAQEPSHRLCSGVNVHDRNIRGATMLHEMLHSTTSYGRPSAEWIIDVTNAGCAMSKGLNAGEQLYNADNYACFAMEVYRTNNCLPRP